MKAKMCSYSEMPGMARTQAWHGRDDELFAVKSKRVRCPVCGRSMHSAVRTCHDGCCIFHGIPPHKIKEWWKKPKHGSKDIRMRRR